MIWIIGGTSETKELLYRIEDIDDYTITAATESEKEFVDSPRLRIGRMDMNDMLKFVDDNEVDLIVDLSHPYAKIVSENAKKVSEIKNIRYIRYVREKSHIPSFAICVKSIERCLKYLQKVKGTVFFTTGSKNIKDFEKVRGDNRFIYRVLPATSSIEICKENGVQMKDIVAILGPFSEELNIQMFKEYSANFVVMKDSGQAGGTTEKIEACRKLQIIPIVISRSEEEGVSSLEEVEKIIYEHRKSN